MHLFYLKLKYDTFYKYIVNYLRMKLFLLTLVRVFSFSDVGKYKAENHQN